MAKDGRFAIYDKDGNAIMDTSSYVYKVLGVFTTDSHSGTYVDERLSKGEPWAICASADVQPFQDSLKINLKPSKTGISYSVEYQKYLGVDGRYTQWGETAGAAKITIIYGVK